MARVWRPVSQVNWEVKVGCGLCKKPQVLDFEDVLDVKLDVVDANSMKPPDKVAIFSKIRCPCWHVKHWDVLSAKFKGETTTWKDVLEPDDLPLEALARPTKRRRVLKEAFEPQE